MPEWHMADGEEENPSTIGKKKTRPVGMDAEKEEIVVMLDLPQRCLNMQARMLVV